MAGHSASIVLGPGEHRVVVDRRVADLAVAEVEPLDEGHDRHEHAGDQTRPPHRRDAIGAELLGWRFRQDGLSECGSAMLLTGCSIVGALVRQCDVRSPIENAPLRIPPCHNSNRLPLPKVPGVAGLVHHNSMNGWGIVYFGQLAT